MRPSTALAGLLCCVAGCGRPPPPALDAAHLPRELHGLMPGVATEHDVAVAFREASAVRDRSFGGTHQVELSGEPAIQVQAPAAGVEAWLIRQDGEARVASIFARTGRACRDVARDLGDRVQSGPCAARDAQANEHAYCASTADHRYTIDVSCFDRPRGDRWGWVALHLDFAPAQERWYQIGPLDAGHT
ncbi:MAG TPA: hypothetical protein VHE35_31335 [Kofleriaceae bacterium]|nr:hypothetical protein [Kofleriaceae bacterium]